MSFSYQLLKCFSYLPIRLLNGMAKILASLEYYYQFSKTSQYVDLNIQIGLPELTRVQQKEILKYALIHETQSYFEFLHIWGASTTENIARIKNVHGAEYFHQALAEQKGLVLIVPHFGTWEIMNAWCAQFTQMTILYKPIKNPTVDAFVRNARSREQAKLVPTNEVGVRELFKALKQGGTTVILPDHSPDFENEMIEYFGIPLYSSYLTAKMIQKTKAKALFLYAMRDGQGGFQMYIEPVSEQIYQGSADDATKLIFEQLEQLIQNYPHHYHWSYKRFKANPQLREIYTLSHQEALQKIQQIRLNKNHHS